MEPLHLGIFLLHIVCLVNSHGNMVKPMPWWDTDEKGWFYDEEGQDAEVGCCSLDLPQDTMFTNRTGKCPDCMKMWFTAKTEIPGEVSLPWDMIQPEVQCVGQEAENDLAVLAKNPWSAPGTAFINSPCGKFKYKVSFPQYSRFHGISYFQVTLEVHQMGAKMMERENLGTAVAKIVENLLWVTMLKTMIGQICPPLGGLLVHSRRLLGMYMQIMQEVTCTGSAKCQREE